MMGEPSRRERAAGELRRVVERARNFSGWSFPDVEMQILDEAPWDYEALARDYARRATSIVDLGTGGGELFERVASAATQAQRVASEEWHVNAPVAARRLCPLGIDVVHAQSECPPFRDAAFDLVLSRHEAIAPREIARILAPGGIFLTQQVANDDWRELDAFFPERTVFPDHYRIYQDELRSAGFDVQARSHVGRLAFGSVADVAFMLLASPWDLPGFDPLASVDALLALEDATRTDDGIVLTYARYLLIARKPA
jgi:SAM-dependent methyltransferase